MTTGMELLEAVYGQLRAAGVVQSKAEFSETLLGKSPSYLTSMRAKQRTVSDEIIVGLGDNLMAEIVALGSDEARAQTRAILRRAVALVNTYLADQTIPAGITVPGPLAGEVISRRTSGVLGWLGMLGRFSGAALTQIARRSEPQAPLPTGQHH